MKKKIIITCSIIAIAAAWSTLKQNDEHNFSMMVEDLEALSFSEQDITSFPKEVYVWVEVRSGVCYINTVDDTYKKDGKTYNHYKCTPTSNIWRKCIYKAVRENDPCVQNPCKQKTCPGGLSEAPIDEEWEAK